MSPNRNALFFLMGPPTANPYWLRLNGGFFTAVCRNEVSSSRQASRSAEKLKTVPCSCVGARLGRHRYNAAHRASELRRVGVGEDLELLDRVDLRLNGFFLTAL